MMFRNWMEAETDLRSSIIDAAHGICKKVPIPHAAVNCRTFVRVVIDKEIDDLPEVDNKDMQLGDVLIWGSLSNDFGKPVFNWGHLAIYLGNDEVLEVPGYNEPMRIKKKWKSDLKTVKVFRPNWDR